MNALWTETLTLPAFDRLDGNLTTDVLIIGGGMAGVLCAYLLAQAGVDYALVEAERVCAGVTANTTAKITTQHGLVYDKLLRRFGPEKAWMYGMANQAALAKFRELCRGIDCDFAETDAFVYALDDRGKIDRELAALKRLGFPAAFACDLPLPFDVAGALRFGGQAQFHPLKFVSHIARGLRIYEHTPVRALIGTTAVTDRGRISANKVIVATHFPFLNKHGGYFLKLYQHRSYVLALERAADVHGMYVDEAEKGLSFRNAGSLLLLGGGGRRTGKPGGGWRELEDLKKRYYPDASIKYRWAAQDCMSLDGLPYIGPYSARTDGLFVASGFNKWGMTSSMVSAMLLCDMAQGKRNPYAPAFAPSRTILRPQLAINAGEALLNLLTPTAPRCPHLGCALKWNAQERSWDCPCHGSRFTEEGHLIDNPATGGLGRQI